jgi:hypothetical protein
VSCAAIHMIHAFKLWSDAQALQMGHVLLLGEHGRLLGDENCVMEVNLQSVSPMFKQCKCGRRS